MVEHLLISLVAPPMLLLGIPGWLTRWLLRPRWLSGTVRVLTRPLVAGVLFNAVVAVSHAPFYVNFTLYHHFWHFWAHLLLFVVSMLMWFPVVNQLPEYPRHEPAAEDGVPLPAVGDPQRASRLPDPGDRCGLLLLRPRPAGPSASR